ncbi:MAG: heparan-alpha-glucosaminide N-acetyltransferase domain-containing protein [bacterium]
MNEIDYYRKPAWAPKMLSVQRITAIDLARFVAMIMMVQGHVIDALLSPTYFSINEFPWDIWHFFRGFTAQVFLIVSGTVSVFANKRLEDGKLKPDTFRRRANLALILIAIGYLFAFPANKIWDLFFIEERLLVSLFRANILQLIGVSLLFVILLYRFTRSDKTLGRIALTIAILISGLSPFVHQINWFNYLPEFFAAYLSFEHGSFFPIFPYTAFMFFGVYLGTILKKIDAEHRTKFIIIWITLAGIVLIASGSGIRELLWDFSISIPTKINPGAIMSQIGYVLLGMGFWAFIYSKTKKFSFYYAMFGKRALMVYIFHLVVLYGTSWFPSIGNIFYRQMTVAWALFFAVLIEFITFGLVYYYEYLINKYEKFNKYHKQVVVGIILYFLLIGNIWLW